MFVYQWLVKSWKLPQLVEIVLCVLPACLHISYPYSELTDPSKTFSPFFSVSFSKLAEFLSLGMHVLRLLVCGFCFVLLLMLSGELTGEISGLISVPQVAQLMSKLLNWFEQTCECRKLTAPEKSKNNSSYFGIRVAEWLLCNCWVPCLLQDLRAAPSG